MLKQFYDFEHALDFFHEDGIHFYDLPSVILALTIIIMVVVHTLRARKRRKNFDEEQEKRIEEIIQDRENRELESNGSESEEGRTI